MRTEPSVNTQEDKMNKMKKMISLLLVLTVLISMAAVMAGCESEPAPTQPSATTPTAGPSGEKSTYTVSVKSAGGMALAGVDLYIYADSTLSDLKQYGETDENGNARVELAPGSDYAIVLSGTPKGYVTEPYYSFNGTSAAITLNSQLVTTEKSYITSPRPRVVPERLSSVTS